MHLYQFYSKKEKRLSLEDTLELLLNMISRFRRIYMVIDTLDECSTDLDQFLESVEKIVSSGVRVLFTSRYSVAEVTGRFLDARRLDI